MNIPDEAIKAAADKFIEMQGYYSVRSCAEYALRAAAPHIQAAAWEEGRLVGRAEEQSGFDTEMNPYAD